MCIPSNLQCNVENAKNFHHVLLLTRTGSFCLINTILLHYCEFCSLSSTTKHQMVLVMFARNTCLWILWKRPFFIIFEITSHQNCHCRKHCCCCNMQTFLKRASEKCQKIENLNPAAAIVIPFANKFFTLSKTKAFYDVFHGKMYTFFLRLTISQNKQVFVPRKKVG